MTHPGNVITLGGAQKEIVNGLYLNPPESLKRWGRFRWSYLNSNLKKILKVLLGFIPAFLTFALTKDWWVLAYGGAFIWFGITGLRNILQSVLGGGGFRRSPLLNWNDYISWTRITDSLLFTGFSVPLLDYAVKTVILNRGFGITTATHPVLLYTFMALANGVYLSSHNIFRGLPKGAIYGNFFRSILSIPVAVALNSSIGGILPCLAPWTSMISCKSGRRSFPRLPRILLQVSLRERPTGTKTSRCAFVNTRKNSQIFWTFMLNLSCSIQMWRLSKILEYSSDLKRKANAEAQDLEKIIMIHALDMLYFWMYQPRSRSALQQFLQTLSEDERHILVSSNFTLQRHREISQMFIDGILGSNFPRPLSFYLSSYEGYLEEIKRLVLSEEFSNAYTQNRLSDFADPEVPPMVAVDEAVGSTGGLLHPPETVCVQDEHKNGLKTKKG